MDVYHNGNFLNTRFAGTVRQRGRLTALPVHQTFLWESQELFIPALYAGKAGTVLDVCVKIPVEDMAAYLKKWPKERRLSLKTPEDYEQLDADNPGSRNFRAEMSLNDMPVKLSSYCSINWYPETVFRMGNENPAPAQDDEWKNDRAAEMLMEAYGCDRESCWHFVRLNYDWSHEPVLSPHRMTLEFCAEQIPITAGHFTTITNTAEEMQVFAEQTLRQHVPSAQSPESPSASDMLPSETKDAGKTIKVTHPVTGQEYTLTLYECRQNRHSFADIGAKDVLYPEYCHLLSYCISPEISRDLFDIRDCAEGDHPRKAEASEESGGSQGATAVFMACKSSLPERRTAVSSMHFEPVSEIRWRMVFQIRTKPNRKITFSI